MGKVKSCLLIKFLGKALLNKRKKVVIFFHTQYFNYLDFFTGNVLFLGHDLIFEVFLSILIAFVQKVGRSPQIHTTGIFYGQKPYKQQFFVIGHCNLFHQFLTKYSLNNDTLDLISAS